MTNLLTLDSALRHIEQYLGAYETACDGVWWYDPTKFPGSPEINPYSYCVMRFKDQPMAGISTFITVGACIKELAQEEKKPVRMEFLMCAESNIETSSVVSILMGFTNSAMRLGRAPFDGEVVEWKQPLFESANFRHLYVSHPIFYDEKLALCKEVSPPLIVSELYPLSQFESGVAVNMGANFNKIIIEQSLPLWMLDRRDELHA